VFLPFACSFRLVTLPLPFFSPFLCEADLVPLFSLVQSGTCESQHMLSHVHFANPSPYSRVIPVVLPFSAPRLFEESFFSTFVCAAPFYFPSPIACLSLTLLHPFSAAIYTQQFRPRLWQSFRKASFSFFLKFAQGFVSRFLFPLPLPLWVC